MDYRLDGLPRPPPLVPGLPQPPTEELEAGLAAAALAETREKLAEFLAETERTGVRAGGCWGWRARLQSRVEWGDASRAVLGLRGLHGGRLQPPACPPLVTHSCRPCPCPQVELEGANLGELKQRAQACHDVPTLRQLLLDMEAVYCHAGEGLPRGENREPPRGAAWCQQAVHLVPGLASVAA